MDPFSWKKKPNDNNDGRESEREKEFNLIGVDVFIVYSIESVAVSLDEFQMIRFPDERCSLDEDFSTRGLRWRPYLATLPNVDLDGLSFWCNKIEKQKNFVEIWFFSFKPLIN